MTIKQQPPGHSRRTVCTAALGLLLLSACEAKPMTVTLDVVLFSYLDRPIFDVFMNGDVGHGSGVYPQTGGGTVSGVKLKLGPQKVTWRFTDTGETVAAKNMPELKDVPRSARYLAIHIYPDDMVELVPAEYYPGISPRGEIEVKKIGGKNGK
jgi:hypothetical protein